MEESWLKQSKRQIKMMVKDPLLLSVVIVILLSLTAFIIFPLIKVIITSVYPDGKFSFKVYKEIVSSWYLRRAF